LKPLVSIIIPCYNGAHVVSDAIRSALAQTYEPKEVIVIDDGSTDGSVEIIRSFEPRIHLIERPRSGLPATRNAGYRVAKGELIQCLDADDLLDPEKLEVQVPLALRAGPRTLTCCRARVISRGSNEARYEYDCNWTGGDFFHACNSIIQAAMPLFWREQIARVNGQREELPCNGDLDLIMRLVADGNRLSGLSLCGVTIRKQDESMTSRPNWINSAVLDIVRHMRLRLELEGRLALAEREALGLLAYTAAFRFLRWGEWQRSIPLFAETRRLALGHTLVVLPSSAQRALRLLGPTGFAALAKGWMRVKGGLKVRSR
jgi:glycosyltransferase involved in cell wall biosynthesis